MKLSFNIKKEDFIKAPSRKIIQEFIESGAKIAAVDNWENKYSEINYAYRNIRYAIKKQSAPVKVFLRIGRLYLERTDLDV